MGGFSQESIRGFFKLLQHFQKIFTKNLSDFIFFVPAFEQVVSDQWPDARILYTLGIAGRIPTIIVSQAQVVCSNQFDNIVNMIT